MAKEKLTLAKVLPYILIIAGIIGIICSVILVRDQIKVWQTPNFHPSCNLNPVVSCGTVIDSKQGDVFSIPAPFFGMVVFPVLTTVGVAILAGARFKRWFWLGLQAGVTAGFISALWLFLISVYKVHALCPFCLTTDVVVYTTFWYVTLYNIEQNVISIPGKLKPVSSFMRRHHLDLLILWFVLIFLFIMHHFWYYYGKHL